MAHMREGLMLLLRHHAVQDQLENQRTECRVQERFVQQGVLFLRLGAHEVVE